MKVIAILWLNWQGAEGELPGSLFHISQDCDSRNISGNCAAVLQQNEFEMVLHLWRLCWFVFRPCNQMGVDYTWDAR